MKSFTLNDNLPLNNQQRESFKELLNEYASLDETVAIGLGGSSSAGTADETSDLDLYVFVEKVPNIEKREAVVKKFSTIYEVGGDYFGPGDEFFCDDIGKEIDLMFFDIKWFEHVIRSVWEKGNAWNGYTTAFHYTLSNIAILYDPKGWLKDLKELLNKPYPEKLQQAIITRGLKLMKDKPFSSFYEQTKKAIERGDLNSINHRVGSFMTSYFDVLLAMNKLLHPGEKRLIAYCLKNCAILPEGFESDLTRLFTAKPEEILPLLDHLFDQLKAISKS